MTVDLNRTLVQRVDDERARHCGMVPYIDGDVEVLPCPCGTEITGTFKAGDQYACEDCGGIITVIARP